LTALPQIEAEISRTQRQLTETEAALADIGEPMESNVVAFDKAKKIGGE